MSKSLTYKTSQQLAQIHYDKARRDQRQLFSCHLISENTLQNKLNSSSVALRFLSGLWHFDFKTV